MIGTILFLIVFALNSRAQNYIGLNEPEIVKNMQKSMPGFIRQTGIVNDSYNYLKYESKDGLQTLLFFMDKKDKCIEVRLNFDRSLYAEMVRDSDDKYLRVSENRWREIRGRKEYSITMTDDIWYFTLKIRATEKQN